MNKTSEKQIRRLTPRAQYTEQIEFETMKVENGMHSRKIFYPTSQYDEFERSSIKEFKEYLTDRVDIDSLFDDATYLRFLYSGGFDLAESARRLGIYNQWQKNPDIQILGPGSKFILEAGIIYQHGRDRSGHPIIYLNMAQADFTKYAMGEYYCAWNNLTKPIIDQLLVPGRVQTWIVIIDTQNKFLLPIHMLEWIVRKLSVVYCHKLEKLFIVNAIPIVKIVYGAIKGFLHKNTEHKIDILGSSDMNKLQEAIDPSELEEKYGGSLANLKNYWPLQINQKKEKHNSSQSKYGTQLSTINCSPNEGISRIESSSQYKSVLNDEDFFYGKKQGLQSSKQPSQCCYGCLLF